MPRPPATPASLADDNGPVVHSIFRISRINRNLIGSLLRPFGLFPGQELLMMQLWERDARSQSDLVRSLGLDPSTVTKMVQRMERSGWIARSQSDLDRRVVVVELTAKGRQLRDDVEKVFQELENETTAVLSERQVSQLTGMLRRMEEHLASLAEAMHDTER